jgi:hypothetical protein
MLRLLNWGLLASALVSTNALADPCGMVPPIYTGPGIPITRVGPQRTYVFYKDGVETYVIRPGFSGKVADFGMLIPFPTAPALRKVPDEVFSHIAAAVDPPEIVVDLRPRPNIEMEMDSVQGALAGATREEPLRINEVKVLHQEAVGMYEVTVLAAGSAQALQKWMDEHGYKYPKGMDEVVNDYVKLNWVWVAEKTRVGNKPATDPKPGMRNVDPSLSPGSTFDGYVQAMGFRFKVDKPVVPMRLSPFNEGEKRQIVYYLTDKPVKFDGVPESLVKRQLPGGQLLQHTTRLLPLRVIGGKLSKEQIQVYREQRNPAPHNGEAKALFASDLLAVKSGQLSLSTEEKEKELLNIGESLDLRGPEIDTLHEAEIASARDEAAKKSLSLLDGLYMTVIDGDFPIEYMKAHDLTASRFEMSKKLNTSSLYNCRFDGSPGDENALNALRYGLPSEPGTLIEDDGSGR